MRLIDVETLELKEFLGGADTPPYAILSHTWTGQEVTFQEWEHRDAATAAAVKRKFGHAKIVGACRRARADGLGWLWCDTNCIDKRSSAELSEAINSMFAWYHDAVVCYAYLEDVDQTPGSFAQSRWFTRGWTLQELLAPSRVVFFDRKWGVLGDRKELASMISGISRIHIEVLNDRSKIWGYSIAQRMSWAADRNTTRLEDIAYCLLGIFDINMPLLYGEGPKAFIRLQHEIIKITDDQSILAWDWLNGQDQPLTPALAQLPACFYSCGSIIRDMDIGRSPYSITNLGISIKVPMIYTLLDDIILIGLNCSRGLYARVVQGYSKSKEEVRVSHRSQVWIWLKLTGHDIYERAHLPSTKVFLDGSYLPAGRTVEKLFLTTTPINTIGSTLVTRPRLFGRDANSAGFAIEIGFGIFKTRTLTYEKAHLPGNFSITSLKQRGYSTLSHELISYGNFSTILSIVWDQGGRPQQWHQTSFLDPGRKISNEMTVRKEWRCLFDEQRETQGLGYVDSSMRLMSIHERIRELPGMSQASAAPLVVMGDKISEDYLSVPQVAVRVIFQEYPKEESIF